MAWRANGLEDLYDLELLDIQNSNQAHGKNHGLCYFREKPMNTTNQSRLSVVTGKAPNPLKFTALLYLKEALLGEKYEQCVEIISLAYELGAKGFEVEALLEDPRRNPRV